MAGQETRQILKRRLQRHAQDFATTAWMHGSSYGGSAVPAADARIGRSIDAAAAHDQPNVAPTSNA